MDFKKCIVESGKKLENSGLTVETWGNISIRDPETGLVYLTPSAMKYSTIVEDDVVVCRLDGTIVEGHRKPTIETGLHLAIYRNREEVNAVIHTHPMYSMVYATQGKDIPLIIDEAAQAMGATTWQIIRCFLMPEALGSMVLALTTGTVGLLGASAMAGYCGGGGVGDLALTYGYEKMNTPLMIVTVIVLVILVQLLQMAGNRVSRRLREHR